MNIQKPYDYFNDEELKCPCCGTLKMEEGLMMKLNKFRHEWGRPMFVTSGYRCVKHNQRVGGAPESQHVLGNAVDITVGPTERYDFVKMAIKHRFRGIGVHKVFMHLDDRKGQLAFWLY